MARRAHFTPELFAFLRELAVNNERAWFQENKDRYERAVREPLLSFIADFGPKLNRISKRFVADPRPVGGSMFRIYRDTRFAKDKRPYKTHASARFPHERGKDVHTPGYYLHLEPGEVFGAAGIWRPGGDDVRAIRARIAEEPARWRRITRAKKFAGALRLSGDTLKRAPRGVDPEHPLIDDLKRKDFIAVATFSERQACAPDFLDRYAEACRTAAPLVRFLTEALDLAW